MTDSQTVGRDRVCVVLDRVANLDRSQAHLTVTESARADAYAGARGRDDFVAGRALLRAVVSQQCGVAAEEILLDATCRDCERQHGAPKVVSPRDPNTYSLSHAGGWVTVAYGRCPAVGVDIESIPTSGVNDLVEAACSRDEAALLVGDPEPLPAAFARLWVAKEAVLKAMGVGLRIEPSRVEVYRRPGMGTRASVGNKDAVWFVEEFDVGPGMVGAVASSRPIGLAVMLGAGRAQNGSVPGGSDVHERSAAAASGATGSNIRTACGPSASVVEPELPAIPRPVQASPAASAAEGRGPGQHPRI